MYPQNKVKVFLNGLWLYVRGNKIAMRLEQKFMEHKIYNVYHLIVKEKIDKVGV